MITEHELHDIDPEEAATFCEEGTVGWPGDPDVVDLGGGENDGVTLVKVTLRKGHPQGKPAADDGGFNGHQLTARLMAPNWDTPARGARVVLLIPGGDIQTPGNPVIVGQPIASPTRRFGRKKAVLDYSGKDVVIVGKSVSLVSEDGGRHVMSVSGEGGAQVISDGSGLFVKSGEANLKTIDDDGNLRSALVLDQDEASLMCNADPTSFSSLRLAGSSTELSGGFITLNFSTNLFLGAGATAANTVLWGATGPAAAPALRVLVQAT